MYEINIVMNSTTTRVQLYCCMYPVGASGDDYSPTALLSSFIRNVVHYHIGCFGSPPVHP